MLKINIWLKLTHSVISPFCLLIKCLKLPLPMLTVSLTKLKYSGVMIVVKKWFANCRLIISPLNTLISSFLSMVQVLMIISLLIKPLTMMKLYSPASSQINHLSVLLLLMVNAGTWENSWLRVHWLIIVNHSELILKRLRVLTTDCHRRLLMLEN